MCQELARRSTGLFGKRIPLVAYPIVAAVILLTFLVTSVAVPERRADVYLEPRHRLGEYLAALQVPGHPPVFPIGHSPILHYHGPVTDNLCAGAGHRERRSGRR